jgi:hypothetical protein
MPEVDVLLQKPVAVATRLFIGKCQASVGIPHYMAYSVYPTSELCASTQFVLMPICQLVGRLFLLVLAGERAVGRREAGRTRPCVYGPDTVAHCISCIVGATQSPRHVGKCWIRDSVTIVGISLMFVRPVECALRTNLIKLMKLLNAEKLDVESVPGGGIVHTVRVCVWC